LPPSLTRVFATPQSRGGRLLPPEKAIVFSPGIGKAPFAAWDIENGVMTVHQWSPPRGHSRATSAYP
jgi:hypothetical protein